jgi:hypothetical protein
LVIAAFVTAFIRSAWEDHLNRSARDDRPPPPPDPEN